VLGADCVQRVGYDESEALLPYDARSFHGYRLLREYFALPRRFLFVRLAGIGEALRKAEARGLDVFLLFGEENLELEDRVEASNFALHCTPAINLFPKAADPVSLTERFAEQHIVPDRLRPMDFEIYRVERVTGIGTHASEEQEFLPFYSASDFDTDRMGAGAYYVTRRVPRTPSSRERQQGRRSNYGGSEMYVMLVDGRAAPYRSDLRQLSVRTLCTNRDLAVLMPMGRGDSDFSMDTATSAPVTAVRCIGGRPSRPMPSHAEGEFLWRAISHLSLNYLSLADRDEKEGAAALRDLLRLYADPNDAATRQEIDGIRSIRTSPITRPVPTPGPIAFARGLEVELTFDERAFTGTGVFLLGAVLAEFFTRYVSMNSFTETVVKTLQRPEVKRWQAKIGQRQML
jgi:type VI secretion system protein ImpG